MMFSWSDYIRVLATTDQIPSQYHKLRVVQLAQAIIESGRGTSDLFLKAGNPNGLKWRDDIDDDYSEKITEWINLKTPSEPNGCDWCQWKTPEYAVMGYWRFINRPSAPYKGWENYATDPEGYLQYIWQKCYATDPSYVSKVKKVFPEAENLLQQYSNEDSELPQKTFKVAIMPGHGGDDPGAVNHSLNIKEKDYNWKEAVEIKARLEALGNYQVTICRQEHESASLVTLQQRANESSANVCLCLHHNACNQKAKGWWLFYVKKDPDFEQFIQVMDKHFHGLPLTARGYDYAGIPFAQDWHQQVWNCIHHCQMPTILFESCFIDNNEDGQWLKNRGDQQIVQKICAGVEEYLEGKLPPQKDPQTSIFVSDSNPPLNVRSNPGVSHEIVGRLDNGTPITVIGEDGNWLNISKPVKGYVHKDLTCSSYKVFVSDPNSPLNVRFGSGSNHSVVGDLINGTILTVVGTDGNWLKISHPIEGYVFASLTTLVEQVFVCDTSSPLNVRFGPGTNFEAVDQLDDGTALTVVDRGFDRHGKAWLRISSPCSGWVLEGLTSHGKDGKFPPPPSEMSESEKYDYCYNIITRHGGGSRPWNLISFRKETSTKANNWDGRYDDITAMIWQDSVGKHYRQYISNTEPSSQYEDRSDRRADRPVMGVDANGDGQRDLGRLPEGYYEYQTGSSLNFGKILCPTASAMAERDTDHDGRFEPHEPRASAGRSMLFHAGGVTNPRSAGCQTMNPTEYSKFWRDLNSCGNPGTIGYTLVRWRSL
jgi:N-acetylmuramoyl-L-alanine amidase/uncharacterized protein YgiM (DUF1202 family)